MGDFGSSILDLYFDSGRNKKINIKRNDNSCGPFASLFTILIFFYFILNLKLMASYIFYYL